jgi:hypothetical protein
MNARLADALAPFGWEPQPVAAGVVGELVAAFLRHCAPAASIEGRLRAEAGVRLIDLIDHLALPSEDNLEQRLADHGFGHFDRDGWTVWRHAEGLFPEIHTHANTLRRLAVKVESVADFLVAQGHDDRTLIDGGPLAQVRKARLWAEGGYEFWAVERHGSREYDPPLVTLGQIEAVAWHRECFRRRQRKFDDSQEGFVHATQLIRAAIAELGVDWTCDLFFAAEREYWQRRNRAARVQRSRQDAVGLGWANHDHHTYRSSREHFAGLIAVLEELGFVCRERFYGGRESGWGAQVLEQPNCRIVIFADVDMTPAEVSGDFAHQGLPPQPRLGTVGLWCQLHGEAFLEAGLHHLECQFDFDAAREQLHKLGVHTMRPFTDFPHLKQAFTEGEFWSVDEGRIEQALARGFITPEQAELFRQAGAIGSHLEILQRDDGYRGFNQTGISEIIAHTDPRRQS